jgi:hypothetical protein
MNSSSRAIRVLSLAAIPCAIGGCITNPRAEALRQQQMIEVGDAMNDMRLNITEMAGTLDSLRVVIARQDTTIARLANVTGVVVVK